MAIYDPRKEDFSKAKRALREQCPIEVPVRVQLVDWEEKDFGECVATYGDDNRVIRFLIRININQPFGLRLDTLAHEWAHAMKFSGSGCGHTGEWGKAYAKCYRLIVHRTEDSLP